MQFNFSYTHTHRQRAKRGHIKRKSKKDLHFSYFMNNVYNIYNVFV